MAILARLVSGGLPTPRNLGLPTGAAGPGGQMGSGRGLQAALPAAKILSPVFRLRRLPEEPPEPEHRWDVEAALRLNTAIGDPVLAAGQVIRRLERPMEKLPMTS